MNGINSKHPNYNDGLLDPSKDVFKPEFKRDSRGRYFMQLPGYGKWMVGNEPGSKIITQGSEKEDGGPATDPGSIDTGSLHAKTIITVGEDIYIDGSGFIALGNYKKKIGPSLLLSKEGLKGYSGNDEVFAFFLKKNGDFEVGDVFIGDYASDNYILWDDSSGTLYIRGDIVVEGDITSANYVTTVSGYKLIYATGEAEFQQGLIGGWEIATCLKKEYTISSPSKSKIELCPGNPGHIQAAYSPTGSFSLPGDVYMVQITQGSTGDSGGIPIPRMDIYRDGAKRIMLNSDGLYFFESDGTTVATSILSGATNEENFSNVDITGGDISGQPVANVGYVSNSVADAVPAGLTTVATGTEVNDDGTITSYMTLTWNVISTNTFDHYLVRYKRNSYTYYNYIDASTNTITIDGLMPNISYDFAVASINKYGASSTFCATTTETTAGDSVAPGTVTLDNAFPGIQCNIIEWTRNIETDLSYYNIYRSETNDSATAVVIGNSKTTYFVDGGLTGNTTYYYWIKAIDTSGNESVSFSIMKSATPWNVRSTDIVDSAITAAKTSIAAINPVDGEINENKIGTLQINTDAVTNAKILDDAITAAKIAVAGLDGTTGDVAANHIVANMLQTNCVTAVKINAGAVTANKLTIYNFQLSAGIFTNNSPTAGKIAWSGCKVVYNGTEYSITNGDCLTTDKHIYWQLATPTVFAKSATLPILGNDDFIVAFNNSGTTLYVWNSTVINGNRITTGSITATNIAGNTITANEIEADTITASEIFGGTITSAEIATDTITNSNILSVSAPKILIDGVVYLSNWQKTGDMTKIDGGSISANTITTTELNFTPVQDSNVVASINASSEGIQISASYITVAGTTVFTSGWATATNAEADINGSNIVNGAGWTDDTAADAAQTSAGNAQTAADAAQADATANSSLLTNIAADTEITPVEKLTIKPIWDAIVTEGTAGTGTIPVQATTFSVSDTDFDTAYAALDLYLNTTITVFVPMTDTTTIVRTEWDSPWKNYYDERTKLLNAIATKAKTLADTAQTSANDAQDDADIALLELDDIAADNKITPVEKLTIKPLWDAIVAEKSDIDTQADTYSVSKMAYGTAYTNLNTYLNTTITVFSSMTTTTNITRTDWDSYWEAYYNAKVEILNAIASATAGDMTKTVIDGGVITTGNIILKDGVNEKAGITASGVGDTSIRIWAGQTHASRATAPFRVTQGGILYANGAIISGNITCSGTSTYTGNAISTSYTNAKCTDANADQTSANVSSDTSAVNGLTASKISGWAHSSDTTKINGGDIYTNTVTATQINVTNLAALSANCGAIKVGGSGNTYGTLSVRDSAGTEVALLNNNAIIARQNKAFSAESSSSGVYTQFYTSGLNGIIEITNNASGTFGIKDDSSSNYFMKWTNYDISVWKSMLPMVSTIDLGSSTYKWDDVFCNAVKGLYGEIYLDQSGRIQVTNHFDPSGAGTYNIGGATRYWNNINCKELVKQGGGGWGVFDDGVELQDGTIVSDTEALLQMKAHPTKKTSYGKPHFDLTTLPKAIYIPPVDTKTGKILPKDKNGKFYNMEMVKQKNKTFKKEKVIYSEGENVFATISILIGAIRELTKRIKELEN